MSTEIRRIVTVTENGKSVISSDAIAPANHDLGGGMRVADIWKVHATPINLNQRDDAPEAGELSLYAPPNGNVLRIADFPPESDSGTSADNAKKMFEKMGAGEASTGGEEDARSGLMHRTESLDYGIVLEGEITLFVDEGEVELKAGDIVIQRGTNHGWVNRSKKYCRMAFVLIGAPAQ